MKRLILTLCLAATSADAQQMIPNLSAESGVYAEAYDITSRAARRPAQSARFFASPTISWMGLEIGSNFMWSTEDQFSAQTMNRYYLNPRWSWGQVHAGDYTPVVSRFTASAVRVRGGGLELTPGRFRIAAAGGLAQDATDATVFDAAPKRVMYAGLVGVGDPSRTFIELSAMRAIDDSSGADSLSVAPQENAVGTISAGIVVGALRLKGEVGGSVFSRDIRASELDSLSQPDVAGSVFTPRLSSRWDVAYSGEARVGFGRGSLGVQYEEIGPGFSTLGNPYLANDKREVRVLGTYRLLGGRLSGSGSFGARNDNLARDKRGTTTRQTGTFNVTMLNGSWLVSSVSVLLNGLTRDPLPLAPDAPDPGIVDSFRLRNVTRSVALVEQARFTMAGVPQTLTLSVSTQDVDDSSPRFGSALDAAATNVVADWSTTLARQYTVSLRPGWDRFQGAGRDESFGSMGLGLSRRAPKSRWSATTLATFTQLDDGSQWRGNLTSGIRITSSDQLSLSLRHTRLDGVAQPFTETLMSMRLTRRW